MTTKTETLADVLRELSELCPERFKEDSYWSDGRYYVVVGGKSFFSSSTHGKAWPHIVLAACMEECEARDMGFSLDTTAATERTLYRATAYRRVGGWMNREKTRVASDWVTSPAIALATALRDALEASR